MMSHLHTRTHTLSSSRYTGGNATKCLTAKDLANNGQTVHLAGAEMQENGKKMACSQCWGDWCHPFHGSQDPVCNVGSWDDSCSETGGGPDNLAAVARLEGDIHGMASSVRCRRDNLKTESTCLDQRICPKPARFEHQHESDPWIHNCNQRFCYNASATSQEDCDNNLGPSTHGYWMEGWRAGAGLCNVHWHGGSHISTRAICEGAGLTWWEGRSFLEGSFNTKDTCKTFCDDGTWPPKQECGAGQETATPFAHNASRGTQTRRPECACMKLPRKTCARMSRWSQRDTGGTGTTPSVCSKRPGRNARVSRTTRSTHAAGTPRRRARPTAGPRTIPTGTAAGMQATM